MAETFSRTINIYVDSGEAQRAYDKLAQTQTVLNSKIQDYLDKGKQVPEKLTKQLEAVNNQMSIQSKKISGELSPSYKDLTSTVSKLNAELNRMSKEDAGFADKKKAYNEARAALDGYKSSLTSVANSLQDMLKTAKGVAIGVLVGNTVQAAVQAIASSLSGLVSGAAKISDEFTDIAKTTNLTTDQVRELNGELGKLDTRTSNSKLRGYAVEAGKLGKESVEDVKRFVEEANQIDVALGEDLGEGAITQIGKVADIFQTSMLKIGSAINTVGQSSSASEAWQTEFLFRTAGIAKTTNIAAASMLGFGAALDINGQQVEASSTSLQNFLIDFTKNTDKFGTSVGMAKGELTKLANEKGVNEAFLTFLENLKSSSKSSDDLLRKLEALGIDGARGASTFLTLANNIGLVREQQAIANKAFDEGTSITTEYDIRNNNFAATLEKISKEWSKLLAAKGIQDFLSSGANLTLNFIKALRALPEWINTNSNALIVLGTVMLAYNAALIAEQALKLKAIVIENLYAAGRKISAAATVLNTIATSAYQVALALLTGQITLAQAATQAFALATGIATGGLTLLVGALVALGGAIALYLNNQRESLRISKLIAEVQATAAASVVEEKVTLQELVEIAKDKNASEKERLEAITKINAISPEYLGNITLETINTNLAKEAIDAYNKSLDEKALKEAIHAKRVELNKQLLEVEMGGLEKSMNVFQKGIALALQGGGVAYAVDIQIGKIKELKAELEALNKLQPKEKNSFSIVQPKGTFSSSDALNLSGGTGDDAAAKKRAAEEDAFKKFYQKLLDLKQESEAALKSEDEKALQKVKIKYQELQRELDGFHARGIINVKKFLDTQKLLQEDFNNEMKFLLDSQFSSRSEKEYVASLNATQNFYDREKVAFKALLSEKKINELEYNEAIESLDAQAIHAKVVIANDYSSTIKKAVTDEVKFKEDAYNKDIDNAISAEKRKADFKKLISTSKTAEVRAIGNRDAIFKDELRVLDEEEAEKKRHYTDGTKLSQEAITQIEAEYAAKRAALNKQETLSKVSSYISMAQQIVQVFQNIAQIQNNIENAELARDKKKNDKLVKQYDEQLKKKQISQKLHDILVNQANESMAKKEDDIKREQFERNKTYQIINATMNTAAAVVSALGTSGDIYAGIALAAVAAAMGAVEIGIIASTKYESSYGDGTRSFGEGSPGMAGEPHSGPNGGNWVIEPSTGKVIAKLEEGEAIIPTDATDNNPEIIDALLTTGRKKKLINTLRPVTPLNVSRNLQNIQYGNGGVYGHYAATAPGASSPAASGDINSSALMMETNQLLRQQNKHLEAIKAKNLTLSIKEVAQKNFDYNYILNKGL